ncbi:MAG: hypothetical protein JXR63_03770 [Spirochaetales bacterium]|nr:hypothetical protein [Spirochaetales bacterium]
MENIFDFKPTNEELEDIFGDVISKDDYLTNRTEADELLGDLYSLFVYRGQKTEAETYLTKITNQAYANSLKETSFNF